MILLLFEVFLEGGGGVGGLISWYVMVEENDYNFAVQISCRKITV